MTDAVILDARRPIALAAQADLLARRLGSGASR
jgi:hypothetical protein